MSSFRAALLAVGLLTALVVPSVGVAAEPSPVPADRPGGTFQDDNGDRHEPYIEALARRGIVRGCSDALPRVCPDASLTRAQFASLLARALQLTGDGDPQFSDVTPGGPHAAGIDAIADAGITQGCTATRFCPGATLTRAQMASLLAAAFDLEPVSDGPFTDVSGTHAPWINAIAEAGITQGCTPDRYCPADPLPRDQMATLLARALEVAPVTPAAPLEGTVAFVHDRSLWTATPGGAEQEPLTMPPADKADVAPVWSPSGRHILGDRVPLQGFELQTLVADVDTGAVTKLPEYAYSLVWSPDGSMLVGPEFDRDLDMGTNLVVSRVDGAFVARLPGRPAIQTYPFGWSPDSTEVYFKRTADDWSAVTDLHAFDVTTGEERRLTGPHEGYQFDESPSISPDGTRLAFIRTDRTDPEVSGSVDDRLVVLELATGDETVLAELPQLGHAAWAPDSTRLAVRVDHAESTELWVVDAVDGSQSVVLEHDQGRPVTYEWSPDSRRLAVRAAAVSGSGSLQLVVAAGDGSGAMVLTGPGDVGRVDWSPDSGWLLYSDDPDGDGAHDLFQVAVDGSDSFRVAVDASSPDWSHLP